MVTEGADQNRTGDRGFADRSLSHLGTAPYGAGDETRTRDIQLGKLTFYH